MLLSIVAQEEANVVPQISEATRTIILYAFAWGHVADELMQIIEVKRETKSHAAYFSDSGNYVDLIRCALFILTYGALHDAPFDPLYTRCPTLHVPYGVVVTAI